MKEFAISEINAQGQLVVCAELKKKVSFSNDYRLVDFVDHYELEKVV